MADNITQSAKNTKIISGKSPFPKDHYRSQKSAPARVKICKFAHKIALGQIISRKLAVAVFFIPLIFGFGVISASGATTKPNIFITNGPTTIRINSPSDISILATNIPANAFVEALLYPKLQSRSELSYMSFYGVTGYPLSSSEAQVIPMQSNSSGSLTLPLIVTNTTNPSPLPGNTLGLNIPGCVTTCQGVYPMVLVVISKGVSIATKAFPIAVLDQNPPQTIPLNVALALNETALPQSQYSEVLPPLANLLLANQGTSMSLVLTGATIAAGENSKYANVRLAIKEIIDWGQTPNHQLIINSMSALNLSQISENNLLAFIEPDLKLTQQVANQAIPSALATNQTFVSDYPLDGGALKVLSRMGYTKIVTPSSSVAIPDQKFTLTSGLKLVAGDGSSFATLVFDQTLAHDLTLGETNFERTALLVADLLSIYEDQPNYTKTRVVALDIPISSARSVQLANQVLAGLSSAMVVKPTDIQNAFTTLETQTPVSNWDNTSIYRSDVKNSFNVKPFLITSSLIDSFQSASANAELINQLRISLYSALGSPSELPHSQQRLTLIRDQIGNDFASVDLTPNHTVTMTSSRASIPISISSRSTTPLRLLLSIKSDRLRILGSSTRVVEVGNQTNTVTFVVATKTLGIFQANLSLMTPDGKVLVSATTLQIRSLTFTIAGAALTIFAVLILALWWIQTLRKGKSRNKNLIPKAPVDQTT